MKIVVSEMGTFVAMIQFIFALFAIFFIGSKSTHLFKENGCTKIQAEANQSDRTLGELPINSECSGFLEELPKLSNESIKLKIISECHLNPDYIRPTEIENVTSYPEMDWGKAIEQFYEIFLPKHTNINETNKAMLESGVCMNLTIVSYNDHKSLKESNKMRDSDIERLKVIFLNRICGDKIESFPTTMYNFIQCFHRNLPKEGLQSHPTAQKFYESEINSILNSLKSLGILFKIPSVKTMLPKNTLDHITVYIFSAILKHFALFSEKGFNNDNVSQIADCEYRLLEKECFLAEHNLKLKFTHIHNMDKSTNLFEKCYIGTVNWVAESLYTAKNGAVEYTEETFNYLYPIFHEIFPEICSKNTHSYLYTINFNHSHECTISASQTKNISEIEYYFLELYDKIKQQTVISTVFKPLENHTVRTPGLP